MTNLTEYLNYSPDYFAVSGEKLTLGDTLAQVCQSIDTTIITMAVALFFAATFRKFVISMALDYWKNPGPLITKYIDKKLILGGMYHLDSLFETIILGSTLFLLYVAYTQYQLTKVHWFFIGAAFAIIGLVLVAKIIGWARKRNEDNILK